MRLTFVILVAIAIIIACCNATLESTEIGRQQDTSVINGDRVLSVLDSNPSKQLLRTAETSDVSAGNIQERRLAEKMSTKLVKKLLKDSDLRKKTFESWKGVSVNDMKVSLGLRTHRNKLVRVFMNRFKKDEDALLNLFKQYKGLKSA
ncbi:hypothetical protein JG687_00018350 [Phytophthora cactorum]|uniref:RxLR effector protein n=1 Tax=Phytophthora cactorum TaxID=29920 RepID=A0A329RLG2_9STRA|nr:hypothetical protein Pcac1_g7787 [Phytophthora cactorum]KAG2795738.1 hypothetical protein PC112_g22506 [Phytophthora cactorum]KAG2815992.1 hypothetical protein PC111_g13322 [Phytophthora cactorum]KAG2852882.1 hypothetical protein PC113_g14646 [Phytophthora cactorum]KAG2874606.1 hypothetical protein PC114_g25176 [Phytophthora cactorum]